MNNKAQKMAASRNLSELCIHDALNDPSRRNIGLSSADVDYDIRSYVLNQAQDFMEWGVEGQRVAIRSRWGRVHLEVLAQDHAGFPEASSLELVEVVYVPDRAIYRNPLASEDSTFRYSVITMFSRKVSLFSLSQRLRSNLQFKVPYNNIYKERRDEYE